MAGGGAGEPHASTVWPLAGEAFAGDAAALPSFEYDDSVPAQTKREGEGVTGTRGRPELREAGKGGC